MLTLSTQNYSPFGSGLVPGPLKNAGEGCGIFCVFAGWIQVGSILSKGWGDSSLSGELISLQGQRFSLGELTWQGQTGSWPAVAEQSMFYSCSTHLAVSSLGLTPTSSEVHGNDFSSLGRREVSCHWPELPSKTQLIHSSLHCFPLDCRLKRSELLREHVLAQRCFSAVNSCLGSLLSARKYCWLQITQGLSGNIFHLFW